MFGKNFKAAGLVGVLLFGGSFAFATDNLSDLGTPIFQCNETDSIRTNVDTAFKTEKGYRIVRFDYNRNVLGQVELPESSVTIKNIFTDGLQFDATSGRRIEVHITVAGMGSSLVIKSPQIKVNRTKGVPCYR